MVIDHQRTQMLLLGCCVALLAAAATPAIAVPPQSPRSAQAAPQHGGADQVCFDTLFYGPLPGKSNYCLALRDWNRGHYRDGLEFLKLAAGWGNKSAQYTLGLIYYGGHHVTPNPARGIAWLKLADERHNDPQITLALRSAVRWATPTQRQTAAQLFVQLRQTYGDEIAAARAWHHWRHWQRSHDGGNSGLVCLQGAQLYAAMHAGVTGMTPAITQAIQTAAEHKGIKHPPPCVGISLHMRQHLVHKSVDTYFDGWMGNVTVGPLQTVPAPARSSGH